MRPSPSSLRREVDRGDLGIGDLGVCNRRVVLAGERLLRRYALSAAAADHQEKRVAFNVRLVVHELGEVHNRAGPIFGGDDRNAAGITNAEIVVLSLRGSIPRPGMSSTIRAGCSMV